MPNDHHNLKFLVLGANSSLGAAVISNLGAGVIPVTSEEVNLRDPKLVREYLASLTSLPSVIINASNANLVDIADIYSTLKEVASLAVLRIITKWAFENNIPLVHYTHKDHTEEQTIIAASALGMLGAKYLTFTGDILYSDNVDSSLVVARAVDQQDPLVDYEDELISTPTFLGDFASYTTQATFIAMGMPIFPSGQYHVANGMTDVVTKEAFYNAIDKAEISTAKSLNIVDKIHRDTEKSLAIATKERLCRTSKRRPETEGAQKGIAPLPRLEQEKNFEETFELSLPDWRIALNDCCKKMQKPSALILVESPLGCGHLSIARTLANDLSRNGFRVSIATGAKDKAITFDFQNARVFWLPGMAFDEESNTVITKTGTPFAEDEKIQTKRAGYVSRLLHSHQILVSELFPIGRWYQDREMRIILDSAREKKRATCCVLREIYFDPADVREQDTLKWLEYFDNAYVVGDETVLRLSESWGEGKNITQQRAIGEYDEAKIKYVGYLVTHPPLDSHAAKLTDEVVVATGGDFTDESFNIHVAAMKARALSTRVSKFVFRHLVSQSCSDDVFNQLRHIASEIDPEGIIVERNRSDYLRVVANSDLLISHCGYNTAAEVVSGGLRSIVVPRERDLEDDVKEQKFRAERFATRKLVTVMTQAELLEPGNLATNIDMVCRTKTTPLQEFERTHSDEISTVKINGGDNLALALKTQISGDQHETQTTEVVLGVDVGGTKIHWTLHTKRKMQIDNIPVIQGISPTRRGMQDHLDDMRQIIGDVYTIARSHNWTLTGAGVGFPGKLNAAGEVYPFSAPNIGSLRDNGGTEFDTCNVQDLYRAAFGAAKGLPIYVVNDAIAQFNALLMRYLDLKHNEALKSREKLLARTVGYLAPGTGLGGGFARVDQDGRYTIVTDGHVHDMMIKLSTRNMGLINRLRQNGAVVAMRDGLVMAGDIASGKAIKDFTGHSATEIESNPQLRRKFKRELKLVGEVLAHIVINLRKGRFEKYIPDQNWSKADRKLVKEISVIFFSGGVGRSKYVRKIIIDACNARLAKSNIIIDFIFARQNEASFSAAQTAVAAMQNANHGFPVEPTSALTPVLT